MKDQLLELQSMASGVLSSFSDFKQRGDALRSIQWIITDADGRAVQLGKDLNGHWIQPVLGHADGAIVFDGRDNEQAKLAFYTAILHVPLFVQILN